MAHSESNVRGYVPTKIHYNLISLKERQISRLCRFGVYENAVNLPLVANVNFLQYHTEAINNAASAMPLMKMDSTDADIAAASRNDFSLDLSDRGF